MIVFMIEEGTTCVECKESIASVEDRGGPVVVTCGDCGLPYVFHAMCISDEVAAEIARQDLYQRTAGLN